MSRHDRARRLSYLLSASIDVCRVGCVYATRTAVTRVTATIRGDRQCGDLSYCRRTTHAWLARPRRHRSRRSRLKVASLGEISPPPEINLRNPAHRNSVIRHLLSRYNIIGARAFPSKQDHGGARCREPRQRALPL